VNQTEDEMIDEWKFLKRKGVLNFLLEVMKRMMFCIWERYYQKFVRCLLLEKGS